MSTSESLSPGATAKKLEARFSVNWTTVYGLLDRRNYGVEIAGLLLRHYFGVAGCIIPVGFMPQIVVLPPLLRSGLGYGDAPALHLAVPPVERGEGQIIALFSEYGISEEYVEKEYALDWSL
ncbi:hypothetical protein B0H17DRAFT_1193731 [Mycena rosella]|uniref:Uncharacterized protein n=1 Tax=Mycena rosella TaxID=1033263 RepID=A0AAD7GSY2_MYCRO|nr:hypothetical protein B0H17DRAFT_1193731 [Mycena rosella]